MYLTAFSSPGQLADPRSSSFRDFRSILTFALLQESHTHESHPIHCGVGALCRHLISMFLRLVLKYPVLGLFFALAVEAWIAVPGELLVAIATTRRTRTRDSWLILLMAGIGGMVLNDLVLYLLSQAVQDAAIHLVGRRPALIHLDGWMVTGVTFLPSVRSTAFVVYGLQGVGLTHFLQIALLSSGLWVLAYIVLGSAIRIRLIRMLLRYNRHRRLFAIAEVVLTIAGIAVLFPIW